MVQHRAQQHAATISHLCSTERSTVTARESFVRLVLNKVQRAMTIKHMSMYQLRPHGKAHWGLAGGREIIPANGYRTDLRLAVKIIGGTTGEKNAEVVQK